MGDLLTEHVDNLLIKRITYLIMWENYLQKLIYLVNHVGNLLTETDLHTEPCRAFTYRNEILTETHGED